MTEKRGLGQRFHVQERCGRLEGKCRQLLPAMQAARRVKVDHRGGEDQFPAERGKPSDQSSKQPQTTTTQDMIGLVDGD
jgi:hypothetical protein